MDVPTLIARIQDHGFEYLSTTQIMRAINDAYHDFCSLERWPFLQKNGTQNYSAGGGWVNLTNPASGTIVSVRRVYDNTNMNSLRFFNVHDYNNIIGFNEISTTATGTPSGYFIEQDNPLQIYLYPQPTATTALSLYYDIHPIELTATDAEALILVPPRYHIILLWGALRNLSIQADDTDNYAIFDNNFDKAVAKARDDLMHSQSDRNPVMIDVYAGEYESDYP